MRRSRAYNTDMGKTTKTEYPTGTPTEAFSHADILASENDIALAKIVSSSNVDLVSDKAERYERVKELARNLDLTTPEGEKRARELLDEYDLPQHMIYGIHRAPITEAIMQEAEKILAELRASGDVS